MARVKHCLCGWLAGVLMLAGGCATPDAPQGSGDIKTRGVYTTLAAAGPSLDLPYSEYLSYRSFGPGQMPEAIVTGFGSWDGDRNNGQPYTLQLYEKNTGTRLFSRDGEVFYGKASGLPLAIRKSGDYVLKLLINNAVNDTWDFSVQRKTTGGAVSPNVSQAAYAQGIFGASVMPDTDTEAFYPYESYLNQAFLNQVQRAAENADPDDFAQTYPGVVIIEFTLQADGVVESPLITGNTLSDELGRFYLKSLTNGAPYHAWPAEVRQAIGREAIKVKATFSYN